jgi:hypothetical protein
LADFAVISASGLVTDRCQRVLLLLCLLVFFLVDSQDGRARTLFGAGWSLSFLLWPIRILWPQLSVATRHIGALGMAAALLTAFALLLDPSESASNGGATDTA